MTSQVYTPIAHLKHINFKTQRYMNTFLFKGLPTYLFAFMENGP